jgi:hypothetical protein
LTAARIITERERERKKIVRESGTLVRRNPLAVTVTVIGPATASSPTASAPAGQMPTAAKKK